MSIISNLFKKHIHSKAKCKLNITYTDGTYKSMTFCPKDYVREAPYAIIMKHEDDNVIIYHPDGDMVIPEKDLVRIGYVINSGMAPDGCTSMSYYNDPLDNRDRQRLAYAQIGVNIG